MKLTSSLFVIIAVIFSVRTVPASEAIDSLRAEVRKTDDPGMLLDLYYDLGIEYAHRSDDSIFYFAALINELPVENDFKSYAHHNLMYFHDRRKGKYESAKNNLIKAVGRISNGLDSGVLCDGYTNLGIIYMELTQYDSAEFYYGRALSLADSLGGSERYSRVLKNRANIYIKSGKRDVALEDVLESIEIDSVSGDKSSLVTGYYLLGNIYLYSGEYANALEAYRRAEKTAREIGDDLSLIDIFGNLAVVYQSIGEYEKAVSILEENLSLIEKTRNEHKKINVLINLSVCHQARGNDEKNVELLNKALEIAEKYNAKTQIAQIYNNLGNSAYYNADYEDAYGYFQKALSVNIEIGNRQEETVCTSNSGWALMMLGKKKECIKSFRSALRLASEIGSKEKRLMALDGLADAHAYFEDYKSAFEYKNRVMALNDSISGEKARKRIAELETLYETEKKEREIEQLKQDEELHKLELKESELEISRLNWQRTGFGLGGLFILLSAFTGMRILKDKKEREKNLAVISEREAGLRAVFEATETERKRIAKDLHDGVGQTLSSVKFKMSNLISRSPDIPPEESKKLTELVEFVDNACVEVRSISHQMMPRVLQEEGLLSALADMLEKAFHNTGVEYQFEHYNINDRLKENIEIALYRICQELINNIIRHADAEQVNVQLFKNKNILVLLVEDNGKGMSGSSGDGIGLMNITGRVETINGEFNLSPSPESGTLATVRIPMT